MKRATARINGADDWGRDTVGCSVLSLSTESLLIGAANLRTAAAGTESACTWTLP